ncbi:LysR family transcriptional regulator [Trinickia mobilis]|uniref:LysR family transcriptional regulator n=1 Tax=Trinickia mobilis TaxID=2816356 RepID=UPI001A90B72E|nr:LysR family transcriptional regulator [Trinickia mobilis]
MDTLQNMRVFVRVVESGSFTAAAQQMEATTPTVSRAVSDLETHLRTRLLNRSTRRIALTEAGQRYFQQCRQILAHVEMAEAEAGNAYARPSGKLHIHAMSGIAQQYVVPAINQYQQRFPEVSVKLTLAQRIPDLLEEGYDVSVVCSHHLPDSGLVSERLGSALSIACAAPSYLERHGVPRTPADLPNHVCLQVITPGLTFDKWIFNGPRGVESHELPRATFQVNGTEAMAAAVREGMGIAILPTFTVIDWLSSGELVWIMPEYTSQPLNIRALYSSREYLDAKIRTWVDFLRAQFAPLTAEQEALRQSAQIQDMAADLPVPS